MTDTIETLKAKLAEAEALLSDCSTMLDGEEESVREEHADLIERVDAYVYSGDAQAAPETIQRIAVTVTNGVVEVADAENWPKGLDLFVVHYGEGGHYHINSKCDICAFTDDTPKDENFTGHFASKVAEAYRND